MEYATPTLELIGPARELIQASAGPKTDGDGYQFSFGFVCNPQDE